MNVNVTPNSTAAVPVFNWTPPPHRFPRAHWTLEDEAARKRRRRSTRPISFASIRAAELNRWFTYQYGEIIPGMIDEVMAMLNVLAETANPRTRMKNWLEWRAPWFDDVGAIEAIVLRPKRLKADALAKAIGLTAAVRQHLNIRTIGAIDMNAMERKQIRAAKKVARQKQRRREAGVMPRPTFSFEKQKPWATLGISRRTWFRRRAAERSAANDTGMAPNNSYLFSRLHGVSN